MFCSKCGTQINVESRICKSCGASQGKEPVHAGKRFESIQVMDQLRDPPQIHIRGSSQQIARLRTLLYDHFPAVRETRSFLQLRWVFNDKEAYGPQRDVPFDDLIDLLGREGWKMAGRINKLESKSVIEYRLERATRA